jgi:broad specificity phosphatase PhoE
VIRGVPDADGPLEVWLVRHGESTWNAERRFQGSWDAPLSTRGQAQAEALAHALAGQAFSALYTSPLARARETARACGARLGLEPIEVADLREVGLGSWEGETVDEVVARESERYQAWLRTPADHPPPGGEPVHDLQQRVHRVLQDWTARHAGQRLLAVAHGGVIASILVGVLGLGPNGLWQVRLENASITRLVLPEGRVLGINDVAHWRPGPPPPAASAAPAAPVEGRAGPP